MIRELINAFRKYYIRGTAFLSVLFGAAYVYGDIVANGAPSSSYVFAGFETLAFSLWYFLCLTLAGNVICSGKKPSDVGMRGTFSAHPFAYSLLIILLFWLPQTVFRYPAGNCNDVYYQIQQGFRILQLTTHHPVFHTKLVTAFIEFGETLGSREFGFFLCAFVQNLVTASIFANTVSYLEKKHAPDWILLTGLLFYSCSFFTQGFVSDVVKDVYYSAFCLLFMLELCVFLDTPQLFWKGRKNYLLLLLSALFMMLFRNNGKYVFIPAVLAMCVTERKRAAKAHTRRVLLLAFVIIVPFAADISLKAVFHPESGSIAEALSLPFQQTARLVKYRSDLITEKEKEIIDEILPYDELADLYDESISDPVKFRYKEDAPEGALLRYFKVWFRQFFRAPDIYVLATLRQNIYLHFPGLHGL